MKCIAYVAAAIDEMAEIDQAVRRTADPRPGAANYTVYVTDIAHASRIRRLVDDFGFPSERVLGTERMRKFWLVVQHMDTDVGLQRLCLERCDFAPLEHAYLYDRVCVNEGRPQKFGTQMRRLSDMTLTPHEIEDAPSVDARRASVGLGPIAHQISQANS